MEGYTHEISGSYIYNEQIITISGKAKIDTLGELEAIIHEAPEKKTYELAGSIMVLDEIMVIDAMESGKGDGPHIFYYLEKNIPDPHEARFDGRYIGERFGDVYLTSDFDFDDDKKILTPEEIIQKVMSVKIPSKEGEGVGRPAVLELKRIPKYF